MSFWEKMQRDLNWTKLQKDINRFQKDIKQNFEEGLSVFKEGGTVFTQKLEQITDEGKKKYKVFNLNMKVQEEFTKLGGEIYDLINKKSKNPLGNRKVTAILKRIKKLESQITSLEEKKAKKKLTKKKTTKKKTVAKRKTRKTTEAK